MDSVEKTDQVQPKKKHKKTISPIPITVRQLESLVRISESMAKVRLLSSALKADVDAAIELFKASTVKALMSSTLLSVGGKSLETTISIIQSYIAVGQEYLKVNLEHTLLLNHDIDQHVTDAAIGVMITRGALVDYPHKVKRLK